MLKNPLLPLRADKINDILYKIMQKGMVTLNCFDVHAHIFPDKIVGKVVCALEEFYNFKWQGDGSVGDLLASMDGAGVKKAVVFSCATKPEQVIPANDFLMAVKELYPERFTAFGTIHPDFPDIESEIRRIRAAGLKGIKLHPDFQQIYIDEPAMMRIYEKLDSSLPLMISGFSIVIYFPLQSKTIIRTFWPIILAAMPTHPLRFALSVSKRSRAMPRSSAVAGRDTPARRIGS